MPYKLSQLNSSTLAVHIPFEILSFIFELACLPPEFFNYSFSWTPKRTAAGTFESTRGAISSTCSYWRRVALNTPLLWSTISFAARERCDFLEDYLKSEVVLRRSLVVPEHVLLRVQLIPEMAREIRDAFDFLHAHLARCWAVDFRPLMPFDGAGVNADLSRLSEDPHRLKELRYVRLDGSYSNRNSSNSNELPTGGMAIVVEPVMDFSGAVKLQDLWISSNSLSPVPYLFPLEGLRLRRLHLSMDIALTSALDGLASSKHTLVTATMSLRNYKPLHLAKDNDLSDDLNLESESEATPIHLEKLRHLKMGLGHFMDVLTRISAPNLTHLVLSSLTIINPWRFSLFSDHLTFPLLTHLHVSNKERDAEKGEFPNFMRFIQMHERLEEVEIPNMQLNEGWLEVLSPANLVKLKYVCMDPMVEYGKGAAIWPGLKLVQRHHHHFVDRDQEAKDVVKTSKVRGHEASSNSKLVPSFKLYYVGRSSMWNRLSARIDESFLGSDLEEYVRLIGWDQIVGLKSCDPWAWGESFGQM